MDRVADVVFGAVVCGSSGKGGWLVEGGLMVRDREGERSSGRGRDALGWSSRVVGEKTFVTSSAGVVQPGGGRRLALAQATTGVSC